MPEAGKCVYAISDVPGRRYCKQPTLPGNNLCAKHEKEFLESLKIVLDEATR